MTLPRFATILAAWLSPALIGCDPGARPPVAPAPAASSEPFQIRAVPADPTAQAVLDELRLQVFAFEVKAPAGHRASFWVEVWRDGKLVEESSEGHFAQPARGQPVDGRVTYSFMDGESMNSPKSRWSSRMEFASGPNGRSSTGDIAWVDDPLKAKEIKSRMAQTYPIATPVEPAKSYTLHAMVGSRGGSLSLTSGEETAKMAATIDVAVFLRARIDALPADKITDSGTMGSFTGPPAPIND